MLVFYRTHHRAIWRWVARRLAGQQPENADKRLWPGWRHIQANPQHCFACMAARENCALCPIQWETVGGLPVGGCQTKAGREGHAVFWRDQTLFEHYQEVLHDLPHISVRARRREIGRELAPVAERIAELPLSEAFSNLWREGQVRII